MTESCTPGKVRDMQKLGTYGDFHFFRGSRSGIEGIFFGRDPVHAVNLIHNCYGESVEGFVDALRAATADPRDRVIAAARAFVASEGASDEDFEALTSAVEALENAECDDEE